MHVYMYMYTKYSMYNKCTCCILKYTSQCTCKWIYTCTCIRSIEPSPKVQCTCMYTHDDKIYGKKCPYVCFVVSSHSVIMAGFSYP